MLDVSEVVFCRTLISELHSSSPSIGMNKPKSFKWFHSTQFDEIERVNWCDFSCTFCCGNDAPMRVCCRWINSSTNLLLMNHLSEWKSVIVNLSTIQCEVLLNYRHRHRHPSRIIYIGKHSLRSTMKRWKRKKLRCRMPHNDKVEGIVCWYGRNVPMPMSIPKINKIMCNRTSTRAAVILRRM